MKDSKKPKARARETSPPAVRVALLRKVSRIVDATGEIRLPCAPSMIDENVKTLNAIFEQMGRAFNATELANLRAAIEKHATAAFRDSPYSRVLVKYYTEPPPHPGIQYTVTTAPSSVADEYERWVQTRDPPLFGKHPDAKVMRLAEELGGPATVAVLDVGAGTGRNTLPLARAGYRADAVELAPALAAELRKAAKADKLNIEVIEGDFLDPALFSGVAPRKYQLIVLAEVVASHFRDVDQLQRLAERSAELLAPGGVLLFSAFIALDGYKPDALAREMSQVTWCCIFTRGELERAFAGAPFDAPVEQSVHDYEHEHLPSDAWPPTGWFENWTQGSDLFDFPPGRAPMELRWFSYRRK
jgi:SAM-dependent methyltransferase